MEAEPLGHEGSYSRLIEFPSLSSEVESNREAEESRLSVHLSVFELLLELLEN